MSSSLKDAGIWCPVALIIPCQYLLPSSSLVLPESPSGFDFGNELEQVLMSFFVYKLDLL